MIIELLGAVTTGILMAGPPGPPYYPKPESHYNEQGMSNCICGPDPQEGERTEFTDPYIGFTYQVTIGPEYIYAGEWNPIAQREFAPYGCRREYRRWCNPDSNYGLGYCMGTMGWLGPVSHQPGCLTYTPPCPRVRIQGMPGQTIRVRCKGDECTNTNGIKPK
mgnify:CR=1 FL=1